MRLITYVDRLIRLGVSMYKKDYKYNSKTIYKKYEVGYGEMLYREFKPYLDHILQLFQDFTPKFFIALVTISAGLFELGEKLFATQEIWIWGISILVALDWLSGTFRALTDPEVAFSFKRWAKTAFKIASFSMALFAVIVGANMFPTALGWLQYVAFALLTANEIYSILDNLKFNALAEVVYGVMIDRISTVSTLDDIKEEVNRRAKEEFKKKQQKNYNSYRAEEHLEHETEIIKEDEEDP